MSSQSTLHGPSLFQVHKLLDLVYIYFASFLTKSFRFSFLKSYAKNITNHYTSVMVQRFFVPPTILY